MSTELIYSDATKLAELIRTREVSPVEVMKAHLDRIEAVNPKVNAIVTIAEDAMKSAREAEAAVERGDELGPLHGVPFTVKDSIDTAGVQTQRGTPIFKGRTPDTDATSVARLKKAGGILLAKTNLPEFSYGIESDNLLSGRTNNPWNLELTPGGSSGGESAAIVAGMSPLGLGTDLAISLRGPAAHTGIVSLKATHGRIPMTGIWPREPRRFWHVGPMARSIRDLSLAFSQLVGSDGQDGYSSSAIPFDFGIGTSNKHALRIGWLVEPGFGPVDRETAATVEAAAEALKQFGHTAESVRIPALERDFALDVFTRLHVLEMKPGFVETTAGRSEDEIGDMARFLLSTPDTPAADYIDAAQGAERLKDGYAEYFQKYDVLLTPVIPTPSFKHGQAELLINGETVNIMGIMSATTPLSVTGLPGVSMRFGTSHDGMPIGVQIVGNWQAESTILHVASLLEQVSPVLDLHPSL
jgi:aspartyl-tRNA(Asn)/glutamyl-tRNA(Gln) amidotransferase subunit A